MWLRFKLFVLIALIWNSLPPSIVDFRSLSSFKATINTTNVNLFTRYWCPVWFYNLYCKLVHPYSMCIFCIVILLMRCVSGPRPFITNKLKNGAGFPRFHSTLARPSKTGDSSFGLSADRRRGRVPLGGTSRSFMLRRTARRRPAASSECRISITRTSPIPSSSRRLANLSHDGKVFATDEIIQKHRRAPYIIHVEMFWNYQIRK